MSWRPEGWKNPHKLAYDEMEKFRKNKGELWNTIADFEQKEYRAFEAGADAMLEVLKELGTPTGLPYTAYAKERKGYLVLIPEEKCENI